MPVSRIRRSALALAIIIGSASIVSLFQSEGVRAAPTVFATPGDNLSCALRVARAPGQTTVSITTGYGATITAKLAAMGFPAVSASSPIRFTIVSRSAVNTFGQLINPALQAVYLGTGITGDTITGVTVEAGSTDQAFAVGAVWSVNMTARSLYATQAAINGLETTNWIVKTANASLPNAQVMGSLATGLVKNTTATGVQSIASPGTDYVTPTGSGAGLTGILAAQIGSVPAGVLKGATGAFTSATAGTDYLAPSGVSGGQTLNGDTASGGNLTLVSTANATKGRVQIQDANQYFDSAGNYVFSHLLTDSSVSPFSMTQTPPIIQDGSANTGTDTALTNLYTAFKFTAGAGVISPRAFGIKLKKSAGTLTNAGSTLAVQVYTNNAGVPGTLLSGSAEPFHFGNVTTSYVQLNPGGGSMTLTPGTDYWIVLILSAVPAGVTLNVDSGMASGGTTTAVSANGTSWTPTAGQPQMYFQLYGSNGQIVASSQTAATINSTSSTGQAIFGTSTFWRAAQMTSTYGPAYYGTSTLGDGATLSTVYGSGVNATTRMGIAGNFTQGSILLQSTTNPVLYAGRANTSFGSFTTTGPVLKVEDATNSNASTGNLAEFWQNGSQLSTLSHTGVWTATNPVEFQIRDAGGQVYNAAAAVYGGGVKAGVVTGTDGAMGAGTTFTAASAPFLSTMVGKTIEFDGPGTSPTVATISAFTNASTITISYSSPGVLSNVRYSIGSDSTAAIQAAIDAATAAGGGIVLIPPGTYLAGGVTAIQLKSNVKLSMYGATLVKRGGLSSTHLIEATGATGTATTLTGNVAQGATTVAVTSVAAAGLAVGDFALLYDVTYKYGTTGRNQEIVRVTGVSGNTLTIATPTYGAYTTAATGAVAKITGAQNCAIEGGTLWNRSLFNQAGGLFHATLAWNLLIVGCTAIGPSDDAGFAFNQSQYCKLDRWSVRDGLNQLTGGYAYGVQVEASSLYVSITNGYSANIRENPITDNARCVQFTNNTCVGHQDDGVNTHGSGCENVLIADNFITDCKQSGITIGYGADNAADTDITVARNMVINSVASGITFASNDNGLHRHQRVKVEGNTVSGFGQNGIYGRLVDFAEICNNTITSNNATGTLAGINASYLHYFHISTNNIHDSANAHGIQYQQLSTGTISENIFQNTGSGVFFGIATNTDLHIRWNRSDLTIAQNTFVGDEFVYNNIFNSVLGPTYNFIKAGAIADADVALARDGLQGINTTANAFMFRSSGVWKTALNTDGSAASLTNIPAGSMSGQVPIANGGTGQATKAPAFDALSPMSALGDIVYGGAAGTGTRLAGNTTTTKKFLTQTGDGVNSAAAAWGTFVFGDLALSNVSASNGNLALTQQTDPVAPAAGEIWNGTQKGLMGRFSGANQSFKGVVFSSTSNGTTVNTTNVETSLLTGMTGGGTLTLPANFFQAGKTVHIYASGYLGTLASTPGTMALKVYVGSVSVASAGAITLVANVANRSWEVDTYITCRTTGAGGTIFAQGKEFRPTSTSPATGSNGQTNTTTAACNTTGTLLMDVRVLFGTSDVANTITCTHCFVDTWN